MIRHFIEKIDKVENKDEMGRQAAMVDALNGGFWGQPETKRHFKWFDALAGQHGYDLETMIRLCKMSPEEAFEEITDSLNDPIGDRLSNLRVTVRNEMRRLSECVKVIDKIGMDLIDEHIDQIAELARAKNNAYILQACKDEADAAPDNDAEWCYEEPNRIVKEAMETVAAMNEPHMHPGDMGAHQEIWDRMKERFDEVSAALDWLSDKQDCARVMLIMVVNLLHKSSAPIHFTAVVERYEREGRSKMNGALDALFGGGGGPEEMMKALGLK